MTTETARLQRRARRSMWALVAVSGGLSPVWRIVGIETPASPDRGEGTPLTWTTEPFRVVE